MDDFLKFHHNCDAYMGVQKERKSTFLTAFDHREKRLAACLLYKIFISVVSECLSPESSVSNTAPRYLYWLTDFRFLPPMSVMG